jgi:hypothetical protein
MYALSHWASRHVWQARFLIILLSIFRGVVGIFFGFMFLKNVNSIQMNVATCLLFGIIFGIETLFHRQKLKLLAAPDKLYSLRIRCLSILYTCNFLLFMLIGNAVYRFEPTTERVEPATMLSIVSYKSDPSVHLDEKNGIVKKQLFSFKKLRTIWREKLQKDEASMNTVELTIIGFLLILLAFPLFALACSFACAGDEVLAILVLLSTIGSLVGGIYLLIKAARITNKRRAMQKSLNAEPPKTPQEIAKEKEQKKRSQKKYNRIFLFVLTIIAAIALALSL